MPTLSTDEIIKATGGILVGERSGNIFEGLSTDSRSLKQGNLFVPLVGEKFNGHDFIERAVNDGATGVLYEKGEEERIFGLSDTITAILVDDTLRALGDIARFWRRRFSIPVVAVTGSSGKTTTKEMVAVIAEISRNVIKNKGNFNNLIGLPLTLLEMNSGHEMAIVEMGTNRRGEIRRLTEISEPDIGVVTNIGPAHLEGFGSLESVREEKGALFLGIKGQGVAITNRDDEMSTDMVSGWSGKMITFGMGEGSHVRATDVVMKGKDGMTFHLDIEGEGTVVAMSVPGIHNVYNALAAAAASLASGIEYEDIYRGLNEFRQIPGRMSICELKNGAYLIDDAYNANPASVKEALLTLKELRGDNESIVVFGDMLELGDTSEELHEEAGKFMAKTGVQRVFLRGVFSQAVAKGLKRGGMTSDQIYFPDSPDQLTQYLRRYLSPQLWILVKGSRGMKMEQFVQSVMDEFGKETA